MIHFTTVLAIDLKHLEELRLVWPTWIRHRPEIMAAPIVVFVDTDGLHTGKFWRNELTFLPPGATIVPWPTDPVYGGFKYRSQREKMLSAFVAAPFYVRTKWFLKLDTDAVAMRDAVWIDPAWFAQDPVFVSSPWSYTKPADAIDKLDAWGDSVPSLATHAPLKLHPLPGWNRVMHRRIISYVYFGRTDWHCDLARLCGDELPIPSQDTLAWYVAKRTGAHFETVRMKMVGWTHVRPRKLADVCAEALLN